MNTQVEYIKVRRPDQSQEDFCKDCACRGLCNVFLEDGESCGDFSWETKAPEQCQSCGRWYLCILEGVYNHCPTGRV